MKHILTFLLVTVFAYTSLSAKAEYSLSYDDDYVFTIHIGAFVKAKMVDFKEIRPYGFLYAQEYKNLLQIYMGDYPTEPAAMKVLEKVKRHGYPDAFVTRRSMKKGKSVRVVQVASNEIGEDIDWIKYSAAGQLYAVLDGNQIKLVTGPFESSAEVTDYLNKLKQVGFNDAFAKRINSILLHKVTSFEAGQTLKFPTEIIAPEEEVMAAEVIEEEASPAVPSMIVKKKPKKETVEEKPAEEKEIFTAREVVPKSYDMVLKTERIQPEVEEKPEKIQPKIDEKTIVETKPKAAVKPKTILLPKIRAKVKRTSAIELQKILKAEAVYANSLDGFYGAGTAKGWEAIKKSNPQLKKYILLATLGETLSPKGTSDILQHYINSLPDTPEKSLKGLETSKEAIAKAYRAYHSFTQKGASKEVNDLMNSAIQQSFSNKKLENKPKFDYKATYDYTTLDQLILHLRYVQGASTPEPALPGWMFASHPKEVAKAFETHSNPADNSYNVQDCSQFIDWEEVNLLKTILNDLNTNTGKDALAQQNENDNKASRILWSAKALSVEDRTKIIDWNTALWKSMDNWAKSDPLHQKLLTPLKITYFQSWVRLEDYFMDKGVSPKDAKGLALSVLKNIVEVPLGNME